MSYILQQFNFAVLRTSEEHKIQIIIINSDDDKRDEISNSPMMLDLNCILYDKKNNTTVLHEIKSCFSEKSITAADD